MQAFWIVLALIALAMAALLAYWLVIQFRQTMKGQKKEPHQGVVKWEMAQSPCLRPLGGYGLGPPDQLNL
jgi:hypothetical protein